MPLAANVTLDDTTWAALALVLTVLAAVYAFAAWRRKGLAAGLRGLAWTLVPVAALLTGTLRLVANILNDVIAWGSRLVFSPVVWIGVIVAAVAALLWVVSGVMRARGIGVRDRSNGASSARQPRGRTKEVPAAASGSKPAKSPAKAQDDDIEDMDDIEAILKRHGI